MEKAIAEPCSFAMLEASRAKTVYQRSTNIAATMKTTASAIGIHMSLR